MKTSELTGAELDRVIAEYQGFTDYDPATDTMLAPRKEYGRVNMDEYSHSTDWSLAGEIIEREGISLFRHEAPPALNCGEYYWKANNTHGPTPLIAAMRCYVASKQGEQ